MLNRTLAACLALTVSNPALAAAATATVAVSHERLKRIVTDETVWRCRGGTCAGEVPETRPAQLKLCRRLGRFTGGILAFEVAGSPFTAEELAYCNRQRS